MRMPVFENAVGRLISRALPPAEGGGFPAWPGQPFDPAATAWAVLGLWGLGNYPEAAAVREAGLRGLAARQTGDGRVPYHPERPESWWPTTAALLAWLTDQRFTPNAERAAGFLLATSGLHWPVNAEAVVAHDTSIRGWSWIENTHSWVEPTALAVLGLSALGFARHARVQEAVRMLLNRQIETGGWNYGNTMTLGAALLPTEESTGLALAALASPGLGIGPERVRTSLDWLTSVLPRLSAPLSLSWAAMGLGGWPGHEIDFTPRLAACLEQEAARGGYETSLLGQILLAADSPGGLARRLAARRRGAGS